MKKINILLVSFLITTIVDVGFTSPHSIKQKYKLCSGVIEDFKVNDDTDNSNQENPSISVDPNGNFVICWESHISEEYPEYAIFAQQFNVDGSKPGTNFRVDFAMSQIAPDIAVGKSGNFIICWLTEPPRDHRYIHAQRYRSDGIKLGQVFQVSASTDWKTDPAITIDNIENFVICWGDDEEGSSSYYGDLFFKRYDKNGAALGADTQVNTDIADNVTHSFPAIAVDRSGNYILCWLKWLEGTSYDILGQRYTSTGEPVGENFQVNDNSISYESWPGNWQGPVVAIDGQGNFLICWPSNMNGNWDIFAQCYNNSSVPHGINFKINDDPADADQICPAITADVNGNFVICWKDNRNGNSDIYAQRFIGNGQHPFGANYKVNNDVGNNGQGAPDVCLINEKIYYTWQDSRNSGQGWDILARVENFLPTDFLYLAHKIPDQSGIPNIDGVIDEAIWNYAAEDSLLFGGIPEVWDVKWTAHEDNLIVWKALWSDITNKIYVAVTVKDDIRGTFDNCDPNTPPLEPYFDDSIEFYTDGNQDGGDYEGSFDKAQQWWVTGENKIILDDYPSAATKEIYIGEDLITAISLGDAGDWTCEAEFKIYDIFPTNRKVLVSGDTIGWNVWYNDSDNDSIENNKWVRDHQVGWRYDGAACKNADYFGKLILGGTTVPVELATFTSTINKNSVILYWTTASEQNNFGFEIQRTKSPGSSDHSSTKGKWITLGFVPGNGTGSIPNNYSYIDNTFTAAGTYFYRLKQIDFNGRFEFSQILTQKVEYPQKYQLLQNYPNPFNSITVISYRLPVFSQVELDIFSVTGQKVLTLVSEPQSAGNYKYEWDAGGFSSGVYFSRIVAGDFVQMKKLIFLK